MLFERLVGLFEVETMRDEQQLGISLVRNPPKHIILHATPLSIANRFRRFGRQRQFMGFYLCHTHSWREFNHYTKLGLVPEKEIILDIPTTSPSHAV